MKSLLFISFLVISLSSCRQQVSEELKVTTLAKSSLSWNDSILPEYNKGQPEITVLNIKIPPHAKLDLHKHPVINAGVLLEGELNVLSENGQELKMKKGDALIELVDTYHYGYNPGNKTAEIIVFYAGVKDKAITEYKKK